LKSVSARSLADVVSTSASSGSLARHAESTLVSFPASSQASVSQSCAASQKHAVYFAQAANYPLLLVSDCRPVCSLQVSAVPESPTALEHSGSVEPTSGHWAMFPARLRPATVSDRV
jgi:hypothetical protein